jgi:hypothetical protein
VRAELLHVGGCTDMTKLIVAFRSFVNMPKTYTAVCFYMFIIIIIALYSKLFTASKNVPIAVLESIKSLIFHVAVPSFLK